ncbi:hypothetical protein BJY04DRAFT_184549 [Aspergillus karnatakaensis]|uniref:putative C2H2 finger domain protein n=1 Tax=Aspergillus karnatakaensis TaxID=1810916 RepID=UPI003CCDD563
MEKAPFRIPCSFPDCKFFFPDLKAMRRHKNADPEHDYCRRCDLDFESEEHLLIHKIKSDDHIVCPLCGIEFGSEGGRDGHIRQFHRASQSITCIGCNNIFRSAAGHMRHIEDGECKEISNEMLIREQSKKLMRKEAIKAAEDPDIPQITNEDPDEEVVGGVDLLCPAEENRLAMANQPKPGAGVENPDNPDPADIYWPKLSKGGGASLEDKVGALAITESNTPSDRNKENTVWKVKAREPREPTVVETEVTFTGQSTSTSGSGSTSGSAMSVGFTNTGQILAGLLKDWNPTNFIDPFTGEFVCPCSKRFTVRGAFEQHIISKSQGRRMQCPGCFKTFKSTAALLAHCEAPTIRCDVDVSNLYAQIVDELTGGFVHITGYNEDGTLKYEAGEVVLPKTKKVGVDLDKIGW